MCPISHLKGDYSMDQKKVIHSSSFQSTEWTSVKAQQ